MLYQASQESIDILDFPLNQRSELLATKKRKIKPLSLTLLLD